MTRETSIPESRPYLLQSKGSSLTLVKSSWYLRRIVSRCWLLPLVSWPPIFTIASSASSKCSAHFFASTSGSNLGFTPTVPDFLLLSLWGVRMKNWAHVSNSQSLWVCLEGSSAQSCREFFCSLKREFLALFHYKIALKVAHPNKSTRQWIKRLEMTAQTWKNIQASYNRGDSCARERQ